MRFNKKNWKMKFHYKLMETQIKLSYDLHLKQEIQHLEVQQGQWLEFLIELKIQDLNNYNKLTLKKFSAENFNQYLDLNGLHKM